MSIRSRLATLWLLFGCTVIAAVGVSLPISALPSGANFRSVDIGSPIPGSTVAVSGGHDLSGSGADIGGRADQFHFAFQSASGDFDFRVRVAGLTVTHPYVQAGLLVRDTLEPNARFAGVFASSPQLGCFVESRSSTNAVAQMTAPVGGMPVNYPQTWLRLQRRGDEFIGYAGFDGVAWKELGRSTLSAPPTMLFGMALASHDTNSLARAEFRELGPVSAADASELVDGHKHEPLGPSNRRTGLIISEIMYHPANRPDNRDLEFVEVYNAESIFIDLTGWRVGGGISYAFPDGSKLEAGEFAVIARDPAAVQDVYGLERVLGPYTGRLNNAGERVQVFNAAGAVRLEVEYSPDPPWPAAADGAGHSLVLSRPSYGEDDPRAWTASERVGGSPGGVDTIVPTRWAGVVINEWLSRDESDSTEFIELHNSSNVEVDLSGCALTDSPEAVKRFRIPDGTIVPPRGFVAFDRSRLGFELNSSGGALFLLAADGTRVLDAVQFSGQEQGIACGRSPDGAPTIRRLSSSTPGTANAAWRSESIVINELMYHPISRNEADQYVELHNRSDAAVDLSGWRFVDGIQFEFPAGTTVAPGGFVVVAKDVERLRSHHPHLDASNSLGNFSGDLSRFSERVAIAKPVVVRADADQAAAMPAYAVISEVHYSDGGRWPRLADGGGSSLELVDADSDLLRAANWAASDETQKSEWTDVEFTGRADHGTTGVPANRFQISMLGGGECLVDDVAVVSTGGTNLLTNGAFENGTTGWSFFGNHSQSAIEVAGGTRGAVLHIRALGDGDTGNNSIRANMTSVVRSGQLATIRAKVRWLSGWPEVLFRVRGNWIELPARMNVPTNLGTPGLRNSRAVANAGPAIFDVTHTPALPRANEAVVVTCRLSDPDGISVVRLRFRVDPASTLSSVVMRDDGLAADAVAGDGIYSARIPGRPANTLVAFRIDAADAASPIVPTIFPETPQECLVRWGDAVPFGSFAHYHLWNTRATEQARSRSRALDNTYRDCTLVYGNHRIIYNAGFRDKGSPYHSGGGDFAVAVPRDEFLLGTHERVFASTGNGNSESTGMRGDVSAWVGQQLGIPYLHSHYMRLYRNGTAFRNILYDLEQPNRDYAGDWFGGISRIDNFYKIAIWFEFEDNNSGFQSTGATLQQFLSGGELKLARYRWNWQPRPGGATANDYSTIFNLVEAANSGSDRVEKLLAIADVEQWMRVFAFNRVLGNWDSWTFSIGQNMYLFDPAAGRAVLMPWDIDFVLGEGRGASEPLWGGHDPVANQLYNLPAFRRMIWRAYQDAVNGPMQPENYDPQVDARRSILLKNAVTSITDPRGIKTYLTSRRNYIRTQIQRNDAAEFAITSTNEATLTTSEPVAVLTGIAPFAVADIEVNGVVVPVTWTSFTAWRIQVPLRAATNTLQIAGRDRRGQLIPGATAALTVRYAGELPGVPAVFLNEWMASNRTGLRDPADGDFDDWFELYNASATSVDLGGYFLSIDPADPKQFGLPNGTTIPARGFRLIWADNDPAQNAAGGDVHTNFRLPAAGGELALYTPDGLVVDRLRFAAQVSDRSEGRFPDGGPAPYVALTTPTPGGPNRFDGGAALALGVVLDNNGSIRLTWPTVPGRRYVLESSPALVDPVWVAIRESTGTGEEMSVIEAPNGTARFYRIKETPGAAGAN